MVIQLSLEAVAKLKWTRADRHAMRDCLPEPFKHGQDYGYLWFTWEVMARVLGRKGVDYDYLKGSI